MWYITGQKYGGNALGLKRVVGFGSYQTAWAWLHKLRHALVRPGRDRLRGKVEVDETYVGGVETGVRGRETEKKAIVVVAIEIYNPFGFGRVRVRQVPDVSGASLVSFVCKMIEPGSELLTDGWGGYYTLEEHNYIHSKTILSSSGDPAHVLMPGVHRIAALLKRWLLGTYQGSVSSNYLDYYLDEYTFRFNRRSAKARGLLFYRLIEQAVQVEHISRNQIILGGTDNRPQHIDVTRVKWIPPLKITQLSLSVMCPFYDLGDACTQFFILIESNSKQQPGCIHSIQMQLNGMV